MERPGCLSKDRIKMELKKVIEYLIEQYIIEWFVLITIHFRDIIGALCIVRIEGSGQHDHDAVVAAGPMQHAIFFEEFPAVHAGHIDIEKDEVRAIGIAGQVFQCFLSALHHLDTISTVHPLQHMAVQEISGIVIIDQQYAFQSSFHTNKNSGSKKECWHCIAVRTKGLSGYLDLRTIVQYTKTNQQCKGIPFF